MVIEPSPLPTASQAQHNTEVANPWILTLKKKKKKTSAEQIRNQSTVTSLAEKTKYSPYKAKANQTKPHYPILQYKFVYQKIKKIKTPIQRKPNSRPKANQTQGETVTSLAGATRSIARHPRLVVITRLPLMVTHPPLVVARREGLVADRRKSQITNRCSASRYFSHFFSLTLTLSLSLSEI